MSVIEGVRKTRPNILVAGTPGTGKTTTAQLIADALGFAYVAVGDLVATHSFHSGKNAEFDTYMLDEASTDKLLDYMEPAMSAGGNVVDFHTVDIFPERWFELVLVLRTDNTILFDRLSARGYALNKVQENVEAEIMQVVLEDAHESYAAEIVQELPSNTMEDLDSNVSRVASWYAMWARDHPAGVE